MHDIRGRESLFNLDTQGFQLTRHPTSMLNDDFEVDRVIRANYYPEIIKLITETLGATQVFPFEHTVSTT